VTGTQTVAPSGTTQRTDPVADYETPGARMYAWLWRRLPGRTPARAGVLALIILAAAAAPWLLVFPWASVHLPAGTSGFRG
jgi:hypothetical protein